MLFIPEIMQVVIVGLMIVVPVAFIYNKAGLSPFWAALVFLPWLGLFIVFLHLAFMPLARTKR